MAFRLAEEETPVDNAYIESRNGAARRECLSQPWLTALKDAQRAPDAWRKGYSA